MSTNRFQYNSGIGKELHSYDDILVRNTIQIKESCCIEPNAAYRIMRVKGQRMLLKIIHVAPENSSLCFPETHTLDTASTIIKWRVTYWQSTQIHFNLSRVMALGPQSNGELLKVKHLQGCSYSKPFNTPVCSGSDHFCWYGSFATTRAVLNANVFAGFQKP